MASQNHLDQLDEQLRMMPKPNVSPEKELQIKQAIMNTRAPKRQPKKIRSFKGITTTIGAITATFLFAILLYGNFGQTPQSTTFPFSSFVDEDIAKIVGTAAGVTYVTEEEELIQLFQNTVGTVELTESQKTSSFLEGIELYNENGELIKALYFAKTDLVRIHEQWYEFDSTKWHEFRVEFFTEKYMVEEDSDDPEIEPEETEDNLQQLMDSELAKAPSVRDWDKIINYIQEGANPNSALLLAAKENNTTITEKILELGGNPNITNENQDTPLTITTSTAVAKMLLEQGADIEHRNARNHSALVKAVYDHQTEMVKLLLEHGANPNSTVNPDSDITVLWMAGKNGDTAITDLLTEYGAVGEGYEIEYWWLTRVPSLSEMLQQRENIFALADIGRLPTIPIIQVPSDPRIFPNQFGEPFESFRVESGTADVYGDHIFIKADEQSNYTAYRYELNPGDEVMVADIESALGTPSSTQSLDGNNMVMSYNLEHYELRFIYDGTVSYPKNETKIVALELHQKRPGIDRIAENIFDILAERDMNELANHVHPEKGLLLTPFLQLTYTPMTDQHEPVTFEPEEISSLLQDQTVYRWGDHGASGLPIEMTPSEFFDSYIYTAKEPDAFYVNSQHLTGPEFFTDYVREVFPNAYMVQYSFHETVEGQDLSWMDLTLIFEEYNGEWKLVGIMHNAWTP